MKTYKFTADHVNNGLVTIPQSLLDDIADDVREFDKTYSPAEKSARSLAVIERSVESIASDTTDLSSELRLTIRGLTVAVTKLVELMTPKPAANGAPKTTPDPSV